MFIGNERLIKLNNAANCGYMPLFAAHILLVSCNAPNAQAKP